MTFGSLATCDRYVDTITALVWQRLKVDARCAAIPRLELRREIEREVLRVVLNIVKQDIARATASWTLH